MLLHRTPTYKFTARWQQDISIQSVCHGGTKQMQTICITVFISDWCITILVHGWWVLIQSIVGIERQRKCQQCLGSKPTNHECQVCDTQITNNHSDTNSSTQ